MPLHPFLCQPRSPQQTLKDRTGGHPSMRVVTVVLLMSGHKGQEFATCVCAAKVLIGKTCTLSFKQKMLAFPRVTGLCFCSSFSNDDRLYCFCGESVPYDVSTNRFFLRHIPVWSFVMNTWYNVVMQMFIRLAKASRWRGHETITHQPDRETMALWISSHTKTFAWWCDQWRCPISQIWPLALLPLGSWQTFLGCSLHDSSA